MRLTSIFCMDDVAAIDTLNDGFVIYCFDNIALFGKRILYCLTMAAQNKMD